MSGEDIYNGRLPEIYDLMYQDHFGDVNNFVEYVQARTGKKDAEVLEYGIGTGRLAIPMAEAGLRVTGTDVSPGMLEGLRAKPTSTSITVHEANFVTDTVPGTFDAVLLMINTIFVAKSLAEQVAVFENAAKQLNEGGFFLVETFNPSHYHQLKSPELNMRNLDEETVLLEQYIAEPTAQFLVAQNTVLGRGAPFSFTHVLRYMFPTEMDAVAKCAGFDLAERTSHWTGQPYDANSTRCISLYRRS